MLYKFKTFWKFEARPKCSNAGYCVRVWRDVSGGVVGIGGAETQETAS